MPEQLRTTSVLRIRLLTVLFCLLSGCAPTMQVVGYGNRPPSQHGLKVELLHTGEGGGLLRISNVSEDIISVNQSPQAMEVYILKDGKPVTPYAAICTDWISAPRPDDFVILGPGQTRDLTVPVSEKDGFYTAIHWAYRLEKDKRYYIDVQLNPYFGRLTKENASQTLSQFKIPNYLHEPLRTNTMILQAK